MTKHRVMTKKKKKEKLKILFIHLCIPCMFSYITAFCQVIIDIHRKTFVFHFIGQYFRVLIHVVQRSRQRLCSDFVLFLHQNISCGHSLELPC